MGSRGHDLVLRQHAIDLLESGKVVREVCDELGVCGQSIYTWRRQCCVDSSQERGLTITEANELKAAPRCIKDLEADLVMVA